MGRPLKLTKPVQARICEAVVKGLPFRLAAQSVGVGRSTLMGWKARGEAETSGPFRDFLDSIKRAEGDRAAGLLAKIREAGESDSKHWTALAWILERTAPEDFGQRQRLDVSTTLNAEDMNRLATGIVEIISPIIGDDPEQIEAVGQQLKTLMDGIFKKPNVEETDP